LDPEADANTANTDQLVKKLVRYALACEYARLPIRRDGIKDKGDLFWPRPPFFAAARKWHNECRKLPAVLTHPIIVLGKHKTPFKKVFDLAQAQLEQKFGMSMVELPMKEKVTFKERRAAAGKANLATASSRAYILSSILPSQYRLPEIIAPVPTPTVEAESAYIGLYTMIISLILLNGNQLPNAKLERYLKRMNADINTPIEKTEALLAKMIRQGYVVRVKEMVGNEDIVEWMVGPRGHVEVGSRGVLGLVRGVYGVDEDADEELEGRLRSSLGIANPGAKEETDGQVPDGNGNAGASGRRRGRRRAAADDEDEEDN
jgi:hypothetical protein